MGLTPDQFTAGRQVKRGSKTYDVLDVVTGNAGNQFALLKSGDSTELVAVAGLREEDSDYESVSVEDQEAAREKAAEKSAEKEEDDSSTSTPRKKS